MKILIRSSVAMILVFTMVFTLGVSAFTVDTATFIEDENLQEEPVESVNPEEPVDPVEPEEPEDPVEPVEPEEPVDTEEPVDPVEPEEPEDPVESVDPEKPVDTEEPVDAEDPLDPEDLVDPEDKEEDILPVLDDILYYIRYFIDNEEQLDLEFEGSVSLEYPVVEDIPHFSIPEGYEIDEDKSTPLPFYVSEDDYIIDVYYISGELDLPTVLEYTVKYYYSILDGVLVEGEVTGEVEFENPEVTVDDIPVPVELPEGYVIDEENSTLPFMVTEYDNVIRVYYMQGIKQKLEYVMNYYFVTPDGEEVEGAINGELGPDDPILTRFNIPTPEELPEGYVVDEDMSTLPFVVTEENNILEVYYEAIPEGEEITLSSEFDGVRVEVSGLLPLGTQLRIDPISETDMDMYLNAIDEQTDILMGYVTLFDISLLDSEGKVIQPNDEVRVSFYGLDHIKADDDVFVYHVKENNVEQDYVEQPNIVARRFSTMSANDVEIEEFDAIVESGKVSFDTGHFSIYIVGTNTSHSNSNNRYQMVVGNTVNLEERNLKSGGSWSIQSGSSSVSLSNTSGMATIVTANSTGNAQIRYRVQTGSSWGFPIYSDSNFYIKVNEPGADPVVHPSGPYPVRPIIAPGQINTSKKAVPVTGMVNAWDVTVRIEAEDTKQTSDIVLVIDTSNSMNENNNRRINSAKDAAKKFINELLPIGNTTNRIAIVEFASNLYDEVGFTGASGRQTLLNAIDNLYADHGQNGGTFTQSGVRRAQELITNNATATHKNIVLLSDGEPTFSYGLSNPSSYLSNQYVGKASYGTSSDTTNVNAVRQTTTSLAPLSAYTTSRVGTGFAMFHRISQNPDRFYNHGNSAIAEAHFSKLTGTIFYTIAFEAGTLGEPILNAMASEDKAFTATPSDLNEVFAEIAGNISSTVQSGNLTDVMGDGFEIPVGNVAGITVSQGSASYDSNTKTLNWNLGGPILGTNRVPNKPTYRYAQIKYRVEINNEMIALNLAEGEDALHPTNKSIAFNYEDPNGDAVTITDTTPGQGLTSPQVDPVLLKIKKILLDDEAGDRKFKVNINKAAPKGFNHNESLVPNAGYVWLTTLRHEGTYNVNEINISGSGITDLAEYDISYMIDGSNKTNFQVNHIAGKPRVDVVIDVTNKLKTQTVNVTINKEVTGNLGDLTKAFAFTVIANEGQQNAQTFNFNLSNGQHKLLEGIPKNATLTLTEVSDGYNVTVTVGGNPVTPVNGKYAINLSDQDITISVTNHREVDIDTGITFDSIPYILILAVSIVGLVVGFIRKRNIGKEV